MRCKVNDVYLKMGFQVKAEITKQSETNYGWKIELHHIGPDDMQEKTRTMFATPERAFIDMASELPSAIQDLMTEYAE